MKSRRLQELTGELGCPLLSQRVKHLTHPPPSYCCSEGFYLILESSVNKDQRSKVNLHCGKSCLSCVIST